MNKYLSKKIFLTHLLLSVSKTHMDNLQDRCGSGWIHEQVVVDEPRHGRVQLLLLLSFCVALFGCPGVSANVFGDPRSLLPLQPVCHHVTFSLWDRGQVQAVAGSSPVLKKGILAELRDSPWPEGFLCTPTRSHQFPPAGKTRWSCIGSSELKQHRSSF